MLVVVLSSLFTNVNNGFVNDIAKQVRVEFRKTTHQFKNNKYNPGLTFLLHIGEGAG